MDLSMDLLAQAKELAGLTGRAAAGAPKQVDLRRAVSAAYYALFHFLIETSCRRLVGSAPEWKSVRHMLSRAFDHGEMKEACSAFAQASLTPALVQGLGSNTPHPDLRIIAAQFARLQEQRHMADYDRTRRFTRADVRIIVRGAETAISLWKNVEPTKDADVFVLALLARRKLRA